MHHKYSGESKGLKTNIPNLSKNQDRNTEANSIHCKNFQKSDLRLGSKYSRTSIARTSMARFELILEYLEFFYNS